MGYGQNPAVQEQPLQDLIAQPGWTLYQVFCDRVSGATERRPGLDALIADARRGAFEVVVALRFDRFARSVKQLVLALEEFRSLGIDFISHQERWTPRPQWGGDVRDDCGDGTTVKEHHP